MMSKSNYPRAVLTLEASRKRKEREGIFDTYTLGGGGKASKRMTLTANKAEQSTDNRLLAGYLAHEFLTQGTLLGQKYDPARAEAAPVSVRTPKALAETKPAAPVAKPQNYADVANLLKSDGAHIPGIVNPTQLARWLQM